MIHTGKIKNTEFLLFSPLSHYHFAKFFSELWVAENCNYWLDVKNEIYLILGQYFETDENVIIHMSICFLFCFVLLLCIFLCSCFDYFKFDFLSVYSFIYLQYRLFIFLLLIFIVLRVYFLYLLFMFSLFIFILLFFSLLDIVSLSVLISLYLLFINYSITVIARLFCYLKKGYAFRTAINCSSGARFFIR